MHYRGCGNEGVVDATAAHGMVGQRQDKILIGSTIQAQKRLCETQSKKVAYHGTCTTMRRR